MSLSKINRIAILPDGNCFFRCVSSFLNKKLLDAERFKNGKIKNREMAKLETVSSMSMRKFVCEYTDKQKHKYRNEIYYDQELYDSIDDRVEQMKNPGEFAGLVEIKSAAKILNLCFNIYVPVYSMDTCEVIKYNLVSKIGSGFAKEFHLVLDSNHYELLIPISNIEVETNTEPNNKKKVYEKSDRVLRKRHTIKYY